MQIKPIDSSYTKRENEPFLRLDEEGSVQSATSGHTMARHEIYTHGESIRLGTTCLTASFSQWGPVSSRIARFFCRKQNEPEKEWSGQRTKRIKRGIGDRVRGGICVCTLATDRIDFPDAYAKHGPRTSVC